MVENLLEKNMTENFSNLEKEADIHVHETQRIPNKTNPKRSTKRHIIIKMANIKDKNRILKAAREKQCISIRMSAVFFFSKEICGPGGTGMICFK